MKNIISTSNAPAAIGPYSQATSFGDLIFTAGQICLNTDGELVGEDAATQTEQCLQNIKAILEAANSSLDNVLKVTVFLKDMADFPACNEVYKKYFTKEFPARSCAAVTTLPKDVLIEMEVIAYKNK